MVVSLFCVSLMSSLKSPEREIKVVRPLYSVEVTETETAKFETEISESDIHATWKLGGEALHPSAVRLEAEEAEADGALLLFLSAIKHGRVLTGRGD